MAILSRRFALYVVVLIVLISSKDVASTDKLFVADGSLGQIFLAETDGDSFLASTFTPLNLTVNYSPIGIDYDYRFDMIYWSDQTNGTIHRSISDGSLDEVIANDIIVPHGIALDLEENKVFWLSAGNGSLYRSDLNGSNLQILPSVYTIPRGITISYNRRKLYITTRGSPAIRSVNTDGTDDAILIDSDIVSPGGIAFDFTEQRLYWTDDFLDKVEFVNPDDTSDRTIVISITPGSGLDLFPYGLALHYNDIYFSDVTHSVIVYSDSTTGTVDVLTFAFSLPAEIHIFMDVCANRCLNNGSCVRSLTSVKCECPFGYLGQRCELDVCTGRCVNGGTCVPFERGSICICPDGFSGSKCDSRSKYAPLIFICDEEAGAILEGSADTLEFSPLPIPNEHRPVAVGYSPKEDFIFWVDARNGTLNRAFRNGSDHVVLGNTFSDITDLTIHQHSQILGYIVTQTNLILQQGFDVASTSKTIYNGVSHVTNLASVCFHPNTDLYALDNGLAPAILRITDNFTSIERIGKSSAMNLSTMTFDRHGSHLFTVDVVKGTLETCDPLGEDQDVLLTYQDTQPVDIEWYRGSPFWTDAGSYKGIGFMAQRGGPSTGVTNLQQFQRGAGVYVYHGIAYERLGGEDCQEDEFPCNDTLCIPISWRCDGLVDCEGEMDEIDCYSEPDSIVFVSDLDTSAIFMATTTNLSFTKLPLTDLQTPTAVDYDPVDSMIYWADSLDGSISSAYLDGTNQQKIVTELGTPDGLFFDVETKMIYWTDVGLSNLGSMHSNGTGRRELLTNLDKPRAIIIVSINRMIYWTEWGDIPQIELCDLNGENRQVVIGNELGWPNGLSYDRIDSRLFWCDALLDKIESSDLYGNDRKLLLDNSHGVLHPFDIIFHHGVVMWTDWNCDCIGVREESPRAWPKTYLLPGGPFTRPGGFHVFEDINECVSGPCQNGGNCMDGINSYTCNCTQGYNGSTCEIDIDECASSPCLNGSTCVDGINYYTCICLPGYAGLSCEIDIDECASSPCPNGSTCVDDINYYTCNCSPGLTGLSCEIDIDECASSPCLNGSTCVDGINYYTCNCPPGLTGLSCEIDINECVSKPCQNGGNCMDGINSYTCNCTQGYIGSTCEIEIDECASIPCMHGGTCTDLINSYTCDCVNGFNGTNCETDINECASGPCLNGATCMDGINFYTCLCPSGHTGVDCFTEISTTTTNTPTTMSTTPTTILPEPIRVVSSPTSLTVSALERVEMTCGFENAVRFEWQKDNITIAGTQNQPVYTILSMTPSDIGYYRCRGEGVNHNGVTEIFTDQASIYITELSNVLIQNARFNINVTSSGDLSDITSQYHSDASEMIENYVQTGLMESGNFEENSLSVVSSNLREGSIIANLNMYVVENGSSSFEIHQTVQDSFQALSAQSDGILDVSTVTIRSTSICPTFTWMSRFGEAVFVAGEVNSRYNSTGPKCPFNTTNAHQPVATALCFGDKISKPKWIPDDNCGVFKNVSELLKEISSVAVTEENAEEIVEQVAIVTENTEELTSSDISDISGLVLDTVNQNNSGREFTAFVVSIVNNVGSADTTDLQEAQDSSNAVSNMFEAYETQLNKVDVEEDPFDVSEENLAVQVRNVLLEELDQGFGLSLTGESATDLSNANITATMGEDSEEQRVGLIAEVRFPPEIASLVDTNVKVIFNVFANPALFSSPSLLNSSRQNPDVNTTVNTPVVLLSIGDVKVEGLGQSINLTFTALEPDYVNQQCVFWDQENSLWSPDGCKIVPSKSGTSVLPGSSSLPGVNGSNTDLESSILETYTCACDHLTNFAILMDIHGATGGKTAYTYLSFIGCAISTVCLVISLGTYLWNKKLRSRQTHQIFICLCATLLGLYITFLTMLALDTARDTVEVNPGACGFLAGLIHFFVLSSIAWMGVEGFNTYLVIVKIFNTYIPNFMVKAGLAAWGIPAIIVILTGGIANTKYARQEVCFIRLWSQVGGLLIPVAVVLVANVVIFILVIRQLSKSSQMAGKIKKDSDATREETIERIKNAIAILVLLGLTWITGYLLLIETFTLVVQALFILFNSFQGLFIFILYCLRKPMVRQQWGLTCSCFEGDVSYGRRVSSSSASDSLTAISKFLTSRRKRKYSTGDEVLTGVSSGTDPMPSPSISNPAYSEGDVAFDGYSGMDYGSYKERADESNI